MLDCIYISVYIVHSSKLSPLVDKFTFFLFLSLLSTSIFNDLLSHLSIYLYLFFYFILFIFLFIYETGKLPQRVDNEKEKDGVSFRNSSRPHTSGGCGLGIPPPLGTGSVGVLGFNNFAISGITSVGTSIKINNNNNNNDNSNSNNNSNNFTITGSSINITPSLHSTNTNINANTNTNSIHNTSTLPTNNGVRKRCQDIPMDVEQQQQSRKQSPSSSTKISTNVPSSLTVSTTARPMSSAGTSVRTQTRNGKSLSLQMKDELK